MSMPTVPPSDRPDADAETPGSAGGTSARDTKPSDMAYWADQGSRLQVSGAVPDSAIQRNVDGMSAVGPLQGFGQMWQKTYIIRLDGVNVSPVEVITVWKQHFAEFWPPRNHFYGPLTGIAPGEVALLNIAVGGLPLSTGVLVLYADDESFTLMTPQGHIFAGWITFSAYFDAEGHTLAQAQVLMRANDPLYELGLRFGGHSSEDRFWRYTLTALAGYFGVANASVVLQRDLVDGRIQWRYARNIWDNAAMRTVAYMVTAPLRWIGHRFGCPT